MQNISKHAASPARERTWGSKVAKSSTPRQCGLAQMWVRKRKWYRSNPQKKLSQAGSGPMSKLGTRKSWPSASYKFHHASWMSMTFMTGLVSKLTWFYSHLMPQFTTQAMWFYPVCSISGFKHDRNMAIPCHSIFGIYEYHLISLYIMMP